MILNVDHFFSCNQFDWLTIFCERCHLLFTSFLVATRLTTTDQLKNLTSMVPTISKTAEAFKSLPYH